MKRDFGMRGGGLMALDGGDRYWIQTWAGGTALVRSSQGGPPSTLSPWGYTHFLATDAGYVYLSTWEWQCKQQIARSPKSGGPWQVLVAGINVNSDLRAVVASGKLFWLTGDGARTIRMLDL